MKKVAQKKCTSSKEYTYEEYKKVFFPNELNNTDLTENDPFRLGVKLAEESLEKHKHILSNSTT